RSGAAKRRDTLVRLGALAGRIVVVVAALGDDDPTGGLGAGGADGDGGDGGESGDTGEEHGAHDMVSFSVCPDVFCFRLSVIDETKPIRRRPRSLWSSPHHAVF